MADWPTVDELKAALGVTVASPAQGALLDRALAAAIEQVELDVMGGDQVDVDERFVDTMGEPSASLAQAALLLAVATSKAPDAPFGIAGVFEVGAMYVARSNPNYQRLLVGSRQSFGIG